MLSVDKDINLTTGTFRSVWSDANYIYAGTDVSDFRQFDWNGNQINTSLVLTSTPVGLTLIGSASAVAITNAARVAFINIAGNTKTEITTNALAAFNAQGGQQIAGDIVNNLAIATTSTTGKVLKINSNFTVTQLSPSAISAGLASCVVFRPDTSTFILGTNTGKVFEMDSSGNVLKTITLLNSPNISAPTIVVAGLSYYADYLAVLTSHGLLYTYKYSTSTIIRILPAAIQGTSTAPTYGCLSDSASGTFILCQSSGQPPNTTTGLTEVYISRGYNSFETIFNESLAHFQAAKIEPSISKVVAFTPDSATSGLQMRIFNITNTNTTTANTRSQDPLGVDVAVRLLRIRGDVGSAVIEIDQNIASGEQVVGCTDDHQYIELAIEAGTPERWDIREFKS